MTIAVLKKIYKAKKIKKKRVIKKAFNYVKYNDDVMKSMLIEM